MTTTRPAMSLMLKIAKRLGDDQGREFLEELQDMETEHLISLGRKMVIDVKHVISVAKRYKYSL